MMERKKRVLIVGALYVAVAGFVVAYAIPPMLMSFFPQASTAADMAEFFAEMEEMEKIIEIEKVLPWKQNRYLN